jgi:predicted transcriptional regulator
MKTNTDENILINFGNNIKVFRKNHDISQFEMAYEMEIDTKVLRNIEKGVSEPRYEMILKIIEYLQEIDENMTLKKLLETC